MYENTLIAFTSDNGAQAGGPSVLPGNAPFSGHKGTYFQGGIRVPLVFHWPVGISDPVVHEHLVSTMDLLPTFIEALNGNVPEGLDGKSLLPLITGSSEEPVHEHLVWAGIHSRAWGFLINRSFEDHGSEREFAPPAWVVVKDEHLLRFTGRIEPDLYTDVPEGAPPGLELFNTMADAGETEDISAEFQGIVDELLKIYKKESEDFEIPVIWERSKYEELLFHEN